MGPGESGVSQLCTRIPLLKLKPTIKSRRRLDFTQESRGSRTSRLGSSTGCLVGKGVSARTGAAFRVLAVSGAFASVCGGGVLFLLTGFRWGSLGSAEIDLATPPSAFKRMERLPLAVLVCCFFAGEVCFLGVFESGVSPLLSATSALSWMGRWPLPESLGFFF